MLAVFPLFRLTLVDVYKQGVDNDVKDYYQCRGDEIVEQIVGGADKDEKSDDDGQRHSHAQTFLHKDVVNVCLVCVKHLLAAYLSGQGYPYDINAGDEQ